MEQFLSSLFRFWYTIAVVFILGRFLYYPNKGKKEFLFTYILLAAIISLVCLLISRVELTLGFAFGIFAIFAIIRYRTIPIAPREMTYIFLCAGIAAKNALAPEEIELFKFLVTDFSILLLAGISEYFLFKKTLIIKEIVYNNLELINPEKRELLYTDLKDKFGISNIEQIQIGKIDMVKNSVRLRVKFKDSGNNYIDDED